MTRTTRRVSPPDRAARPAPAAREAAKRAIPGNFATRVYAVVSRIPAGRVATYGDVARLAGRPAASRAVGQLMRAAKRPHLPYHRVVAAGGRIGGYGAAGTTMKAALLRAEGVTIRGSRIVGFERWRIASRKIFTVKS